MEEKKLTINNDICRNIIISGKIYKIITEDKDTKKVTITLKTIVALLTKGDIALSNNMQYFSFELLNRKEKIDTLKKLCSICGFYIEIEPVNEQDIIGEV